LIADIRWFSVAGLVLDIIGALMLWRYGLPEEVSRSGAIHLIGEQEDAAEKALARRYDWLARLGLTLLILGFVLQLIGSWPRTPR
jgi:hypothetical protein